MTKINKVRSLFHAMHSDILTANPVKYNPKWANGTGYFNGAVRDTSISLRGKRYGATEDDSGRRIIIVRSSSGSNIVVFERYGNDDGSPIVFNASNEDNDLYDWSGEVKVSLEMLFEIAKIAELERNYRDLDLTSPEEDGSSDVVNDDDLDSVEDDDDGLSVAEIRDRAAELYARAKARIRAETQPKTRRGVKVAMTGIGLGLLAWAGTAVTAKLLRSDE